MTQSDLGFVSALILLHECRFNRPYSTSRLISNDNDYVESVFWVIRFLRQRQALESNGPAYICEMIN